MKQSIGGSNTGSAGIAPRQSADTVFTGIIQSTGEIVACHAAQGEAGDLSLTIRVDQGFNHPLETGASIS
ncbi:MAG: hypothetical protein OEM98_03650, partial [Gammaproteobacteria bacterium]|nr:hypothetical protein [Gammaproteobacteria bacterium]